MVQNDNKFAVQDTRLSSNCREMCHRLRGPLTIPADAGNSFAL
jgi:hypothetical protein